LAFKSDLPFNRGMFISDGICQWDKSYANYNLSYVLLVSLGGGVKVKQIYLWNFH